MTDNTKLIAAGLAATIEMARAEFLSTDAPHGTAGLRMSVILKAANTGAVLAEHDREVAAKALEDSARDLGTRGMVTVLGVHDALLKRAAAIREGDS